jgi:hypothetical protein
MAASTALRHADAPWTNAMAFYLDHLPVRALNVNDLRRQTFDRKRAELYDLFSRPDAVSTPEQAAALRALLLRRVGAPAEQRGAALVIDGMELDVNQLTRLYLSHPGTIADEIVRFELSLD